MEQFRHHFWQSDMKSNSKLQATQLSKVSHHGKRIIGREKYCEICGKLVYQVIDLIGSLGLRLCSCYQIFSGWIESTLTKKPIPILYLPWLDTFDNCVGCGLELCLISDCQKWCLNCSIVYTGCRYCLTTNIIFGIANESQCKKCKRTIFITIDITNISSGNYDVDEFLNSTRTEIDIINCQIADYMNNISNISDPLDVYYFIKNSLMDINSKS